MDLFRVLAGRGLDQLLADLGCRRGQRSSVRCGDDTRAWGPPYLQDAQVVILGKRPDYLSAKPLKTNAPGAGLYPAQGSRQFARSGRPGRCADREFKVGAPGGFMAGLCPACRHLTLGEFIAPHRLRADGPMPAAAGLRFFQIRAWVA